MSWKSCVEKLIKNIPFPTLVFDDSNKMILMNSIESQAFNWSTRTISGQSLFDLFPSEKASLLHDVFVNAMESKKPCVHSMDLMPSDKSAELKIEMIPIFNIDTMSWNLIFVFKEQSVMELEPVMEKPGTEDVSQANWDRTCREGEVEEAKAALRFLLREGAAELGELKKEMYDRLANQILPFIDSLQKTKLAAQQKSYLELLEVNVRKLVEPFSRRISDPMYKLSPMEAKISHLVREGKTNKEIAKMLKLSKSTILTHRHHVRAKLGLKNKKQNLRSYLSSFG